MSLLKVYNSSLQLVAILKNVVSPNVSERINSDFTFSFSALIEREKVQYLIAENIVEVDNNYFKIAYYKRSGINLDVVCEHVSYDLIEYDIAVDTTYTGTSATVLNALLASTPFAVGTVSISTWLSFKVVNTSNVRKILLDYAAQLGAELIFDKYTVHLVAKRGNNNGVQFRNGKNLKSITEEIDIRGGGLRVAYDVDIIDLSQLTDFPYLRELERAELGDTINVIDEEMLIDIDARIVSRDYNPFNKLNPCVEIGNYIRDIGDLLANTSSDIQIL